MSEENKLSLSDLEDAGMDNVEILFDSFLKDGVFKEIPIVKTIFAVGKTAIGIRDYLLINKICAFMKNIQNIPQGKIDKFINEIDNPKKITEIGMKLIQVLDRLDDVKKAELIGKLYKLLIEKQIDQVTYFRICYIIDKCYYNDIDQLRNYQHNDYLTSSNPYVGREILENLFSNGLLSQNGADYGKLGSQYGGTKYILNDYGKIIFTLI